MNALFVSLTAALVTAGSALAAPSKYLTDFDFISSTVAKEGAAVKSKKIDWRGACARLKPDFADCTTDAAHLKNVAALLAVLQDGHTGLTADTPAEGLPRKWDGLFGGGLWFAWDNGRVVLRGVMEGHPAAADLLPGSTLLRIQDEPAWFVMEREYRRITQYEGISSAHSLWSSLGNRLLPFGGEKEIEIALQPPAAGGSKLFDAPEKKASVLTFGPGGKAFDPVQGTLPAGVTLKDGACSGMIPQPWSPKVGYLRITGSMNDTTVKAFHLAFDALKDMEVFILDGRGMGGGADASAWEMAGRIFPKTVSNGRNGQIKPSGSWQFGGPVVFLQDETMVSSAETFTWAMNETERVVSVGRPTGGWAIIPRVYKCPSGIVSFRLGVTDRPTPVRGLKTEGIGWMPDVKIPYGPVFAAQRDPVLEMALSVAQAMHLGLPRKDAAAQFGALLSGKTAEFVKGLRSSSKLKDFPADKIATTVKDDLAATLQMEAALLAGPAPETARAPARLAELSLRAKNAGLKTELASLEAAWKAAAPEAAAQKGFLELADAELTLPEKAAEAWQKKHAATRFAQWLKSRAAK